MKRSIFTAGLALLALPAMGIAEGALSAEKAIETRVDIVSSPTQNNEVRLAADRVEGAQSKTTVGYKSPQPSGSSSPDRQCCAPRAQPCASSCCSNSCCGDWCLGVDALYWRQCGDGKLFTISGVVVSGVSETDIYHRVKPDNEWGVRVKGGYTTCDGCRFATLSYLHFDESDHARVNNPLAVCYLTTANSELSFLKAQVCSEYQRLDGRVGHYICRGCRGGFYGYGGISWIYLEQKDRLSGVEIAQPNTFVQLNQRAKYSAAGFEAGVGGCYKVCGGFGLAGELGGIAAIGERTVSFQFKSLSTGIQGGRLINKEPSVTTCVPGLDLKLEAFYENCCRCFNWEIAIGYEHHQYFDALRSNRLYFGPNNNLTPSQYSEMRNMGFGGLTLSARVGY